MGRPRTNPWHDIIAFLLLASATLVIVIVLLVTRHYYSTFEREGQIAAWAVVAMGILGLASLAASLLRLYIQPAFVDGRARLASGSKRRKRNA